MEVRDEIKEVIIGAGRMALQNTVQGELTKHDEETLRANLENRIPTYTGRYPILGILQQLDAMTDPGNAATSKTHATMRQRRSIPNLAWDEETGSFRAPIASVWQQAIQDSARQEAERHFAIASDEFAHGRQESATTHLCSAIVCSIAAIAALMGWPHGEPDDDLGVIVALATGSLPPEGERIYTLLRSASQQGQDLNSAFAAAMGQPEAVRTGAFEELGRTPDEAFTFAKDTITMAYQLAQCQQ